MIRFFDADGNKIPSSKPVGETVCIAEIGGRFEETSVTLSVYSEELDREEVSSLLGTQPTKAWNSGELHPVGNGRSGKQRIVDWGKWWFSSKRNCEPIETKIRQILQSCTGDLKAWQILTSKYDVWLTIAAYADNWNRELRLPADILQLLAERNLSLDIDAYFYGDDDDEQEEDGLNDKI